ncbi:MAG: 2-phosphosulfolactate phosphatase [Verrucomicrobiota bacterium]|nr:2-phosphosulfolactate phosphatase [Limisphaera sp.]MDW8383054.1 2-phosphosulfolactate phosphatase [Verrucomicrobiota bacterium]
MLPTVHTLLGPAEWEQPQRMPAAGTVCVVFDVLRATSTIVTALAHGARAILPVESLSEAVAHQQQHPEWLLAGERGGWPPGPDQTGGVRFHFGNSPREFTPERVGGRNLILTTTNGSRALRACDKASVVLAASFLNLKATVDALRQLACSHVVLVCAGTGPDPALEDILAAGALLDCWKTQQAGLACTDAAAAAWHAWKHAAPHLTTALLQAANAQRLRAHPELQADIEWCLQTDRYPLAVWMHVPSRQLRGGTPAEAVAALTAAHPALSSRTRLC